MDEGRSRGCSAALATIALVAIGAGCGGGASKPHAAAKPKAIPDYSASTTPPESTVSKAAASETFTIADSTAPAKRRSKSADPSLGAATPNAPAPPPPSSTDAGAAVRQAISDTLATAGWTGAQIAVLQGGLTVNVALPRRQACGSDLATGNRLLSQIRAGAPGARTVTVTVAGTGLDLSAYRRARCAAPRAQGGGGRVVYSSSGSGPATTPEFTIAGSSWTVTYTNRSDFFEVFVLRGGQTQPFVIRSSRPGSGTETMHGSGRFKLKINSGDGWSISVRDGA
ncbi:MAG: hypothetical protein QOJ97_2403 [Solirubrobacteraceae bacterium]|jgi:hypothetical protein|nr:hypothetical protein [Solirubrobacteraceae bacterium]